jgi:hypothetical protein
MKSSSDMHDSSTSRILNASGTNRLCREGVTKNMGDFNSPELL